MCECFSPVFFTPRHYPDKTVLQNIMSQEKQPCVQLCAGARFI